MILKDKVILITGASRGIGRAIAINAAKEGAITIVNYVQNSAAAEEVVKEISASGGIAKSYKANVANHEEVDKMVDEVFNEFKRIDILVNNAAIVRDQLLLTMEPEDWHEVINTNLGGLFNCTKAVSKYMIMQKSGKIINISSVAGEKGGKGQSNYAASKGGVNAFTKAVAMELAPKKITVNAVAPGVIETEMSETVIRRAKDHVLSMVALKRLGVPEDVANVVIFLASDKAAYITGEIIHVDGGFRN
ncbi:MAG: 3-oxoacyl-ACP reductase family protein [Candidatus Anammoxibacter sp.]